MNSSASERFSDGTRALQHERRLHEAFAASRRYGYEPREGLLERLDDYVAQDAAVPLVISGPPGAGKSALMAYWAEHYRKENPGAFLVEHYIETEAGEARHYGLVRHIMLEIKERYNVAEHLPGMPGELEQALAGWLWYVQGEPMVLLIDGLNRLPEESRMLRWLPSHLPPAVRLIITTSQEEMRDALRERGWETMEVAPLGLEERQRLAQRFIAERNTDLTPDQLRGMAADSGSSNPLLLRMRLEEAHVAAGRDDLKETIERYLKARDLDEIFGQILVQLESEHGAGLVREVTTLLIGARSGLSERELAAMTGASAEALSALVRRLKHYLLPRGGLLTFHIDSLCDAIRDRYLSTLENHRRLHLRLAAYFERLLAPEQWGAADIPSGASVFSGSPFLRLAGELAHQLRSAGEWERLRDLLAPIPIMVALYNSELRYEFLSYLRQVETWYDIGQLYQISLRVYRAATHEQQEIAHALETLGVVLQNTGHWGMAEEVYREALRIAEGAGVMHLIATANGSLGRIRAEKGDLRGAMRLFRKQMAIAEELGDRRQMAMSLGCMGNIHVKQGEFARAMECYGSKLAIAEELGDRRQKAHALGSMGVVCAEQGDYENAMEYYRKQLLIGEELEERVQIAQAVGNMGIVFSTQGDYENALACHQRKLAIAREMGNKRQIANAVGNVGLVYYAQGNYASALLCHKDKLAIAEELGDQGQIAMALGNMGVVYYGQGDYHNALVCYDRKLAIAREMGNRREIATVLGDIGIIYYDQGDFSNALSRHTQKLEIARELGDRMQVATALGYIGAVYKEQGKYARALSTLNEALAGHMAIGNKFDLVSCLCDKANLLVRMAMRDRGRRDPAERRGVDSRLLEARQLAEECITLSGELSRQDTMFEASVLLARIGFESGDREQGVQRLSAMLEGTEDERHQAALKCELARMNNEMGAVRMAKQYARDALMLCSRLVTRMPSIEYEEWRATLRGILGH